MLAKIPKTARVLLISLLVVAISVLATVFVANYFKGNQIEFKDIFSLDAFKLDRSSGSKKRNYDLFAGHSFCEDAIRKRIKDRIISLTSDDRAAKVNQYARTNILTFKADIVPGDIKYRSEQHSTREFNIKCSTSIDTNNVVNITVTPVDEL
jgi:hypothetical protein